jgi:Tripartite tricarboxylate transporter family receptor
LDHALPIETICNIAMLDLPGLDMLALSDRLYSLAPTSTHESLMSKLNAMIAGLVVATLTALTLSVVAQAQTEPQAWPQRTVKFIVGLGPGSAQDIAARLFGDQLSKHWGQPVVIENKPGADGIIAINAFVGAHDAHTLLFAASGTFTAHPTQYAKLHYDPSDLVPLARVSSTIIAVSVPTALNVQAQPGTDTRDDRDHLRQFSEDRQHHDDEDPL